MSMIRLFIESVVKGLVDNPSAVSVQQVAIENSTAVVIQIRVAGGDIARVIGSEGRVFRALRTASNLLAPGQIKEIVVDVAS